RQLPQGPLALLIGLQKLSPQIIRVGSCHRVEQRIATNSLHYRWKRSRQPEDADHLGDLAERPGSLSLRSWDYWDGTFKSLQIFFARSSLISECRGTAEVLPAARLT
ncbi:MAG TPA: hypothetical protein VII95_02365, partial [Terriglobales bacterium]